MKKLLLLAVCLTLLSSGCGKVSKSPLAPFINPSVYNNFDGSLNGWGFCYAKYDGTGYSTAASMPASLLGIDMVSYSTAHIFGGSTGAAKINVSLGAVGDSFDSGIAYSAATDVGFEGKVLSAWVYWDTGLTNSSGKVIAKFYGKFTDNFSYESGSDTTLVQGRWVQVTWPVDQHTPDTNFPTQASYEAALSQCREWGIEIYGATGPFSPGVLYLDQVAF